MKKMNEPQMQDINGLFQTSKILENKIIVDDEKIDQINQINSNNDNKEKASIISNLNDKKIQNFATSYIPINTLSDLSYNFNLNSNNALITSNEMKSNRNKKDTNKINSEEILENGLNLDEQNIVNYDEKITNKNEIIKKDQNDEKRNNININIKSSTSFIEENNYLNKNNQNELTMQNNEQQNLSFGMQIPKELFDQIEYAIDENGNPFNIKQNNKDTSLKKPVALIIQKEKKDQNYLIDLQGKKIPKMEDGYFNYKNNNIRVIIQDFDVQHPELRVYGTRNRNTLSINEEEKAEEKEENNIDEIKQKYSLVLNKKLLNFKRNSPIKIKNIKYVKEPKSDNRIKYNINRNKKQIAYRRIVPVPNPSTTSQYLVHKFSNNYTINRTSNILNKSMSTISHHNRSYTKSYSKNDLINIKYDQLNNTDRNKLSVTPSREIKNVSYTSSRINLFNYKRNRKKGGSFNNLNKVMNINNIIHRNTQSLNSLPSSNFEDDNTNIDLNNNKKGIKTNYSSLQIKNFKKSQSSHDVSSTINNISDKIKYIKNKINNTNKILTAPSSSTISISNSQKNNISKDNNSLNTYNYINKINNNNSSLYKRQFKCAILSKEVNDIISDYSTENQKKEIKNNPYLYENKFNTGIKNSENKINSFLNGHSMTNLMFKRNDNNYSTQQSYLKTSNLDNNVINVNNNDENCRLCGRNLLNRIKSQCSNTILQNGIINFKRKKMNVLLNIDNNNTQNTFKHSIISQNYKNCINLLNNKNRLNNRSKFSLISSRNSLLNLEENKSQTNAYDYYGNNNKNNLINYKYSASNTNNNSRNFDFS